MQALKPILIAILVCASLAQTITGQRKPEDYPIDKKGKGSLDHHFMFDVQVFVARLDPMIELMSSLAYALEQEHDLMCEAMGEARQTQMEHEYENADHGDPGDYDTE